MDEHKKLVFVKEALQAYAQRTGASTIDKLIARDILLEIQGKIRTQEALRISLTTNLNLPRYDGSRLGTDDFLIRQSDVVHLIASQQTIDAVPVLRCKECDAWDHGLCRLLCADTEEDGYCHWARKKRGVEDG